MEESRLMRGMLLDFYGELLTAKQRRCCELYYNEDLSLSEIAEQCGVSRQGVWDNIRRADAALAQVEEKTGLVRRFIEQRAALERLRETAERLCSALEGPEEELARKLLDGIAELTG